MVVIHVVKLVTYASLGVLTPDYVGYGLAIGLAAVPANFLGQYLLRKMNEEQFRQLVFAFMGATGVLMIWQQRQVFNFGILDWVIGNWQLANSVKLG